MEIKQKKHTAMKIITALFLFFIIGASASMFFSPVSFKAMILNKVMDRTGDAQGGEVRKSTVFQTKEPKPYEDLLVSQKITAKEGGTLTLIDPKGVKITLAIPAGGLEKDTTISMAPLQEVPIVNYTSSLGNGVVIEPEGLVFKKMAVLTFDFKPSTNPAPTFSFAPPQTLKLAAAEFDMRSLKNLTDQIMQLQKQTEQINQIIQNPSQIAGSAGAGMGQTSEKNTLAPTTRVVHVQHDKGRVSLESSTLSVYGSQILVGVTQLSSHVPDTIDPNKAGQFAEDGLGSGSTNYGEGGCDSGTASAILMLPAIHMQLGDGEGEAALRAKMEQCIDEQIKYLENLCKNDRIALRRRNFTALIELIQAFGISEEKQKKVVQLMVDCRGTYQLKDDASATVGEGTLTLKVDAEVCGYPDDQWTGTENLDYLLPTEVGPAGNGYKAPVKFMLPPEPGAYTSDVQGTSFARNPLGAPLQFPYQGPGHNGIIYDKETVEIGHWYGGDLLHSETKITMKKPSCDLPDPTAALLQ